MEKAKKKRKRAEAKNLEDCMAGIYSLLQMPPERRTTTVSAIIKGHGVGAAFGTAMRELKIIEGAGRLSTRWIWNGKPNAFLISVVCDQAKIVNSRAHRQPRAAPVPAMEREDLPAPGEQLDLMSMLIPSEQEQRERILVQLSEVKQEMHGRVDAFIDQVANRLGVNA